jgi:hypothetical protein
MQKRIVMRPAGRPVMSHGSRACGELNPPCPSFLSGRPESATYCEKGGDAFSNHFPERLLPEWKKHCHSERSEESPPKEHLVFRNASSIVEQDSSHSPPDCDSE